MEGDVRNQTRYQNAASSPQNSNKTTGTVAPPTVWGCTFSVSSRDKNFILSPMSMHWLTIGKASLTLSSMATGGMFSPPAVMISSGEKEANRLCEQAAKGKTSPAERTKCTKYLETACRVENSRNDRKYKILVCPPFAWTGSVTGLFWQLKNYNLSVDVVIADLKCIHTWHAVKHSMQGKYQFMKKSDYLSVPFGILCIHKLNM